MNVLSVDPSSSTSGIALFINSELRMVAHHNSNKKLSLDKRLIEFGAFLRSIRGKSKLDYVSILKATHQRNTNTIRMIAFFEAVAMMKCAEWGATLYHINDSSARKLGLGKGNLTKEECYNKVVGIHKLSKFSDGGSDESDAVVCGLACINFNG